jgi:hypothetical protein
MVNRSDVMHTITMPWLSVNGALEVIDSIRWRKRVEGLFYFTSVPFFLSLRWGFGSDQTRTEAMEDLLQLGAPPYQCNTSIREDAK